MHLTILGNSSGGPFHGRHYTSQVLQVGNQVFLIDCGEGAQMQLFRYRVKFDACKHIFISHLHGDHVFGLMGLITNWCLKKRGATLHLYSPPGLRELVETTIRVCGVRMTYALEFHEADTSVSAKIFENQQVEVWTIPLRHRLPASGWLFREKSRLPNIRPEKVREHGIHFSQIPAIKSGADLALPDGRIVPNADLTLSPPPPCSYAFCSDTTPSDVVAEAVRGVDLLYHEATFTTENEAQAAMSFHSTAAQAAEIARRAGVKRLILGHFSGRYADEAQHLAEARAVFPETQIAAEGHRWQVGQNEPPTDLLAARQRPEAAPLDLDDGPAAMKPQLLTRTSKFLSQILRHRPEKIGLTLDANGWAEVSELLEKSAASGTPISPELLRQVVENNDKQRYSFSPDGRRIRANQGHSISIDLGLKAQAPPEILYHGTAEPSLAAIRKSGLLPMRRQHVHLSREVETAQKVGGRHGKAVVLEVLAGEMHRRGHTFFCSDNGVWLTEGVPTGCIVFPEKTEQLKSE
jgi:ribonuclease Z